MKFIHTADIHFDTAFKSLNCRTNLGQIRRLDQRAIFNTIINRIKSENIKYLFISGDLYEHKFIRESTIDFINSKFLEIPDTYVFISPGNHDPFIHNSFYNTYNWAKNVKIFNGELEKVETEDFYIYGCGFTDFTYSVDFNKYFLKTSSDDQHFEGELDIHLQHDKPNILVMHASLDSQDEYNPISSSYLRKLGFDYVALGHIHKTNFIFSNNSDTNNNITNSIIYPGSPIAMGFDELGSHGIIEGEFIQNELDNFSNKLHLQFLKTDNKEFTEPLIDISNIFSLEALIEKLNSYEVSSNEICKIVLTGSKNFNIPSNLLDFIKEDIIAFKDNTHSKYNLQEISNENSLKGLFVRNLLKQMPNNPEQVQKALEVGLDLFNQQ